MTNICCELAADVNGYPSENNKRNATIAADSDLYLYAVFFPLLYTPVAPSQEI